MRIYPKRSRDLQWVSVGLSGRNSAELCQTGDTLDWRCAMKDKHDRPSDLLDARDLEYIERERDLVKREAIYCTVAKYRRPDSLAVGDPIPELKLTNLSTGEVVHLQSECKQPLALFFGSYT